MTSEPDDDEDDESENFENEAVRHRRAKYRPIPKRPEVREDAPPDLRPVGVCLRVDARQCVVDIGTEIVNCRLRGSLFLHRGSDSRPVAVGDRVKITHHPQRGSAVVEVLPRKNVLSRPHADGVHRQVIASNIDQALLVVACKNPDMNLRLVDRTLVACGREGFEAVLVINKVDLADSEFVDYVKTLYEKVGYKVIPTSVVQNIGIDELRQTLRDRTTVVSGMSGVGKSALVTAVDPHLSLRSGAVSDTTGKGKHTTTSSQLLRLEVGGFVVDTPGIREFGLDDVALEEIGRHFREFAPFAAKCPLRTCLHEDEDDCAVAAAARAELIHPHRYDSYLRIMESVRNPK